MYRFSLRASCALPSLNLQLLTLVIITSTPKLCVQEEPHETNKVFTDEIVAHIPGGENKAYQLAVEHNLEYVSQVISDHYLFKVPHRHRRNADSSTPDLYSELNSNPQVLWFEQQYELSRKKRDEDNTEEVIEEIVTSHHNDGKITATAISDAPIAHSSPSASSNVSSEQSQGNEDLADKRSEKKTHFLPPNDPYWNSQWYLHRSRTMAGKNKQDMNVIEAWEMGYSGQGVVITIIDDGIEGKHQDIAPNFDKDASADFNDNDNDATPRYDATNINKHGTRCAGEVAAAFNNNACIVGVAYNAKVGGIRMLDGKITDSVEARSLSYSPQHIDIYSSSWGPDDDGKTVDGPKKLALTAFSDGILKGRGGKGSIFVWAAGNGGKSQDDCNCDGYTTSIYTLSIASTTEGENFPWYSERCSSTLASTYSSGGMGERSIVTTDLRGKCTDRHTGTSASAPLAAGMCALALEANPYLNWRDMQHIVLRTARPLAEMKPKDGDDPWVKNGAGRWVSHSYGYGLMDAGAMVALAKKWPGVPPQRECVQKYSDKIVIPASTHRTFEYVSSGCEGNVMFLEHVVVRITLTIPSDRGKLSIKLTSPAATTSTLLYPRNKDTNNKDGFVDWQFMSVHHWGETPKGKWTLVVTNANNRNAATLSQVDFHFYGTLEDPKFGNISAAHLGGKSSRYFDPNGESAVDSAVSFLFPHRWSHCCVILTSFVILSALLKYQSAV